MAILDADKEGFLRSETSMIQVIGRAARNEHGHVIMYADRITKSMKYAIDETNRRRTIQQAYNEEHHIIPHTVQSGSKILLILRRSKRSRLPMAARIKRASFLMRRSTPV